MLSFTGCGDLGFGKDDFFGTWRTTDFVTDSDGNATRQEYYVSSDNKYNYRITWTYDGTSENMFSGGTGTFTQYLERFAASDKDLATPLAETFWTGEYQLKANSDYNKGKLYLYYEYGATLKTDKADTPTVPVDYETVKTWKAADFLNYAFYGTTDTTKIPEGSTVGKDLLSNEALQNLEYNKSYVLTDGTLGTGQKTTDGTGALVSNGITVQVRKSSKTNKIQCSDVEYFRFNLADSTFYGYARMMATTLSKDGKTNIGGIYNQWAFDLGDSDEKPAVNSTTKKTSYGYWVNASASWSGTSTRYLARVLSNGSYSSNDTRTNDKLFNVKDDNDSTDYVDMESDVTSEE